MFVTAVGERFNPYRRFKRVSVIPNGLLSYPDLSPSAKLLWSRLAQYAGKDGRAYPSISTLATGLGLKERQTQNLIAELKRKGFIESSKGSRANLYYFLLHPCLVDGVKQTTASSDANNCLQGVHYVAPKETNKENQRKKTTKRRGSRGVSFSDLYEEEQRYIELKTAYEASRGKIHSSAAAFRAGLMKRALQGELDFSGLKELVAWNWGRERSSLPPEALISSADKAELNRATIDRVQKYAEADGRSTSELCGLIKKLGKERPPKGLWGLSYQSVAMGLKTLHPEYW